MEEIDDDLALLIEDLPLSDFEEDLAYEWPGCLDRKNRSFRVISAFWRLLTQTATAYNADLVLVDLGPNLGSINRAALIAADYVVVPLAPDLFSLQELKNLGPTLQRWREEWNERAPKNPTSDLRLPKGSMQPIGYIILQHGMRADRPLQAFQRWMVRIPDVYEQAILNPSDDIKEHIETPLAPDPNCLAMLKNYQSLMPMAQEAHKPIFHLKPADGAIGAHTNAVKKVYGDFKTLAHTIASQINIQL